MITTKEAYEHFQNTVLNAPNSFWLDALCKCLFDEYVDGIGGYEYREILRAKRPSIYEDLEKVKCLDDFEALVARYKLEGVN